MDALKVPLKQSGESGGCRPGTPAAHGAAAPRDVMGAIAPSEGDFKATAASGKQYTRKAKPWGRFTRSALIRRPPLAEVSVFEIDLPELAWPKSARIGFYEPRASRQAGPRRSSFLAKKHQKVLYRRAAGHF